MRRLALSFLTALLPALVGLLPAAEGIRLIVRADDMGSAHAANLACIQAYKEGIVRSVELMVPGPWFPEAVKLLNENPGLDVGVHLVLTSEWANMKWRPLTYAPGMVDADGYFFPMDTPNPNFPPNTTFKFSQWKLAEVEKELRAQIETARRHLPRISHLSSHMGATRTDPSLIALEEKLAKEYNLELDARALGLKSMQGWTHAKSPAERIQQFINGLEALQPGTYVFVEHPGYDVPELQALGHVGYEDVAADRDAVTRVFTSKEVRATIEKRGIQLLSLKDAKEGR